MDYQERPTPGEILSAMRSVPVEKLQPGDFVEPESCPFLKDLEYAKICFAQVKLTEHEPAFPSHVRIHYEEMNGGRYTGFGNYRYEKGTLIKAARFNTTYQALPINDIPGLPINEV